MTRPIKVFFTGGGGAGTIEAVKALKAQVGRYEVVTADATPTSAGFSWADRSYVIPFGADDAFVGALREIVRREEPDFIIPLVDEEIPKVHRFIAAEAPHIRIVGPTLEFSELVMDKWEMARALDAKSVAVARTWLASDAGAATYPAIVKPRSGRGSRGLAFLESPQDLAAYLAAAPKSADHYIVQDRLRGREFTTSVVVGLDGTLFSIVPKEAADKRGITQVGITRAVPAIDELCKQVTAAMDPRGPFNVQLILGEDGIPRIIEINPRYSTTMALTLAAGVNEVDIVLRHARGEDPGQLTFEPDLVMMRYTAQIYVKESEWKPVDLRPT